MNDWALAAGVDKNAEHLEHWANMGFQVIEVGTLTRSPRPGNPQPHLRFVGPDTLHNRVGGANRGLLPALQNVVKFKDSYPEIQVGVNIGAERLEDWLWLVERIHEQHCADYITLNVSSPNIEGLAQWQQLPRLLELISNVRGRTTLPLLIKLSPSLCDDDLLSIAHLALAWQCGLILFNTAAGESGAPRRARTRSAVRLLRRWSPFLHLVASGGVLSATDAQNLLDDGANRVQVCSAIYLSKL